MTALRYRLWWWHNRLHAGVHIGPRVPSRGITVWTCGRSGRRFRVENTGACLLVTAGPVLVSVQW